tara:strand:- start:266 stop:823 length:558 start_codon:yes stop_codon:yes gene_type:complete
MAKAIKKVKEAAAKLAKLRKKPGMSNAGKYPNVPKDEFAGPSGTYPINTLKRAKSAERLAYHSPHQASILNKIYKKYPQLEEESKEEKRKKSPVAYDSSPFPLKQERDKRKKGKKYKTGADIDETDWESHNKELNVQDISRIQEDKKGQYITSVYNDTIRPTKGRHFKMTWGEKERNFTPNPNRK